MLCYGISSPQNAVRNIIYALFLVYLTAFSTGGEANRTTAFTPQPTAPQRRRVRQGKAWRSVNDYKHKRSKTALLRALPIKFAVRIFPLGRKGVKFCGKRQSAIFYYLPQNEGKTTAERVGFSHKSVGAKCFAQSYYAIK